MIKTFKIGEEAIGGIVQVKTKPGNVFEVKCFDYNTLEKVAWRFVYSFDELEDYIEEISTPYWADKIVDHFKDKL
jgi:hypothetical protein